MDFENGIIENAAENAEERSGGNVIKYALIFAAGVVAGVAGEKLVQRSARKRVAKKAAKREAEKLAAAAAQEVNMTEVQVEESK